MQNLLSSAWKFTVHQEQSRIEGDDNHINYYVRDNGIGFDIARAEKLFAPFQACTIKTRWRHRCRPRDLGGDKISAVILQDQDRYVSLW